MPRPTFADPKTDFAFKRIFGSEEHKDVLVAFLNDMLDLDAALQFCGEFSGPAAVLGHDGGVAGPEPWALWRGVAEVVAHQAGVGGRDGKLAGFARRDRCFVVPQDRDVAAGLGIAGGALGRRAGRGAGEVGGNLGHAEGFVQVGAGPGAPEVAEGQGKAFPGREAVAQVGQLCEVRAQELPVDAGGRGEDGGLAACQKRREVGGGRPGGGDQCRRADSPVLSALSAPRSRVRMVAVRPVMPIATSR